MSVAGEHDLVSRFGTPDQLRQPAFCFGDGDLHAILSGSLAIRPESI
jgi:hypothetical protein